jgi:tripartite-type tricarboxylate transporter receptor subunit TctC
MKRPTILAALGLGLLLFATAASSAQDGFPNRRVTLLVPSPAGSTTDALARILAEQLHQKWNQPVLVENNSRGLNAGAEQVSRATPDGYTILLSAPLPLTVANLLFRDITYNPSQFVPIAMLTKTPTVLSVRRNFPANNVKELVAYAKANPDKVTYASQGVGSTAHLTGAQLDVRAGIKMVHVPYRGAAPALNDLIAGHVDIFFDTPTTSVPLFRSDKIKILAIGGSERIDDLKELPTIAESGFPGFRAVTWFAMAGPPKMTSALAERINRDVVEILRQPAIAQRLRGMQLDPMIGTPADAAKFFAEETALWGGVIKEAKVTIP